MSSHPLPRRRTAGLLVGLLGALGLSAAPAPAASTHSGDVSAFSFQPAATTAGGSANLNADLKFGSDTPKSVELDWPAGLWASLKTAPAGTQIGSGSLTLTGLGLLPLSATATLAMSSSIPAGAPAACSTTTPAGNCTLSGLQLNATALGQTITAPGYVVLNPSTASLQIVFPSIPNTAIGLPITLTELKLTLNASTANGQFIRLPSNTGTDTTTVKVTGYGGATGTGTDSFTPSGSPAFSPGVAAATANVNAAQQAQVIIDIQQPGGQAGATTHSLVIPGSILNVSGGAIADLCGPPNPAGNCDGETITTPVKVGSVALTTPLLPTPVPGDFWLSGSVSAPVVTVAFPALGGLSFSGKIDPSTIGTNPTVNFTGIPDVPFTDLKVTMDASSTGLFNAACIPASGPSSDPLNWSFTSWWSAAPPVSSSTPFTVNGTVNDCPAGGSSGPDPVTGINNPDPGTGPTYTDTTTTPTTTGTTTITTPTTTDTTPDTTTTDTTPTDTVPATSSTSSDTDTSGPPPATPVPLPLANLFTPTGSAPSGPAPAGSAPSGSGPAASTPGSSPAAPDTTTSSAGKPKPATTVGKPTLTNIVLTGVGTRKPKLAFTVNQGKNAGKISSFTVEPPGAFSFNKNALKKDLKVTGPKLKSYKLSGRKLTIYLKTAASHPRVTLNPGALSEWKQLQTAVRKHKAKSLNMNVWANAGKTSTPFRSTIKKFS